MELLFYFHFQKSKGKKKETDTQLPEILVGGIQVSNKFI